MRTMTFAESRSAPEILPWREAQLRVERTDISFENAPGNQVQIQVRVASHVDAAGIRAVRGVCTVAAIDDAGGAAAGTRRITEGDG